MNIEFWIPLIVVAVLFVAFCWYDIARAETTKLLPKWAWAIICVISVPLGGLFYFILGKVR